MRTIWITLLAGAVVRGTGGCTAPVGTGPLAMDPSPPAVAISAPEATSLLGEPLHRPALDPETRRKREADLADARSAYDSDPEDEEAIIWLGRRLAYLGRYREAVEVFSEGLAVHPDSYKLLRHRGHRSITLRRLAEAVSDLERAADLISGVPDEVEPDGMPNAQNIPRSSSHTNIYYHLGLAKYLQGNFTAARMAYRRCLEQATNDDMRVAAAYWLYLARRRTGDEIRAAEVLEAITGQMDVIENFGYHELLLLFKGERTAEQVLGGSDDIDDATRAYGVAAWHLLNGRDAEARSLLSRIVAGPMWPAFGHIGAEAELARVP